MYRVNKKKNKNNNKFLHTISFFFYNIKTKDKFSRNKISTRFQKCGWVGCERHKSGIDKFNE